MGRGVFNKAPASASFPPSFLGEEAFLLGGEAITPSSTGLNIGRAMFDLRSQTDWALLIWAERVTWHATRYTLSAGNLR